MPTEAKPQRSYNFFVVGVSEHPLRDLYHWLLRSRWGYSVLFIVSGFLAVNALYALAYMLVGGVSGLPPRDFVHAFYFSVQTLGTIGYGAMYPQSHAAHALVVSESVVSLMITALATGLVFAKFSQPSGAIRFATRLVICPWEGVPTLVIRLGNERSNYIVEANVHVEIVRSTVTREGVQFYKQTELKLARSRTAALSRSWLVMHAIDENSPLYCMTPEDFARDEIEFIVSLQGVDENSYQPVHGRRTYEATDVVWGARHADALSSLANGDIVLDQRKFDEVVATKECEGFPYPRESVDAL